MSTVLAQATGLTKTFGTVMVKDGIVPAVALWFRQFPFIACAWSRLGVVLNMKMYMFFSG